MVTRLQSDKKAFVQSPKKAFDTEEEVQYIASLSIQPMPGPWQGVEPTCVVRSGAIGQPGQGYSWSILVQRLDGQPFNASVIRTFVYEQAPSVQQLVTQNWITGATFQCTEGSGTDGFYTAPSVPMTTWPAASIYRDQARFLTQSFPTQANVQFVDNKEALLVSAWLPTDWVGGVLQVVST